MSNTTSLDTIIANKIAEIAQWTTSKPSYSAAGRSVQWQAYFDGLQNQLKALREARATEDLAWQVDSYAR